MMDLLPRPSALLFDMDGTLTEPLLDFPRIKSEMGIGNQPILEAIEKMNASDRARAEEVLRRHEVEAAERSTLNAGCGELMRTVRTLQLPCAVITRNDRDCADTVFRRHDLTFACVVTRDDPPYKPDPAPLRLACERLAVDLAGAWMIGDGQYDVEAGNAARIVSIWLSHGRAKPFAAKPTRTVCDLHELRQLLMECAGS